MLSAPPTWCHVRKRAPLPPSLEPNSSKLDKTVWMKASKWFDIFKWNKGLKNDTLSSGSIISLVNMRKHNQWITSGNATALTTFSIWCHYIYFSIWRRYMYYGRSASVLHPFTTNFFQIQLNAKIFIALTCLDVLFISHTFLLFSLVQAPWSASISVMYCSQQFL